MKKTDNFILILLIPVFVAGAILVSIGIVFKMVGWLLLLNRDNAAAEVEELN